MSSGEEVCGRRGRGGVKAVRYRHSSAARVMRDSQGCAGAVRVRSAVSAGAVAVTPSGVHEHTCLCMPGTYAYSPPVPQRAGWLACHAGWRERWAGRGVAVPPISLARLRRRSTACRCCSLPTACTSPCRCLVMQQKSGAALQQQHELEPVQQLQLAIRPLRRPCRAP